MGIVFDREVLGRCAARGLDRPLDEGFAAITEALLEHYPRHVRPGPPRWIFNNAGGAMGQLHLLHASLSEYLIFFGSAVGTEGHSGRYATAVSDWMIAGEMWCQIEGRTERQTYGPGQMAHLERGQTKAYRLPSGGWMLEYARGPIPQMLPFGLADSILSTLDYSAVGRTLHQYGGLVLRSLLRGKV